MLHASGLDWADLTEAVKEKMWMSGAFCTKDCPVTEGFGAGKSSLCPSLVQKCQKQGQNMGRMWHCPLHVTIVPVLYIVIVSP